MIEFIFLVFCITSGVQSDNPILSLTKCPSGTNECVKKFARELYALALIPNSDIGAQEIDPVFLKQTIGSILQLKLTLTNTTLSGFRTCQVQKASYDLATDKLQIEFLCAKFLLNGQYEMTGRLLTEPVEGDGTVTVETGDNILKLMNDNWKAVAFAYQDPTFGANFKMVVKNINKYLKITPVQ